MVARGVVEPQRTWELKFRRGASEGTNVEEGQRVIPGVGFELTVANGMKTQLKKL